MSRDWDTFKKTADLMTPGLNEAFRLTYNNNLAIRYLDKVLAMDDGYELAFKAGESVELEA